MNGFLTVIREPMKIIKLLFFILATWMLWLRDISHASIKVCILMANFFVPTAFATVFTPDSTDQRLDTPHRGFAMWGSHVAIDNGLQTNHYDSSVYHVYLPWRMIETSDQVFDWPNIEATYLQPILTRHPEATFVIRLFADYPGGAPGNDVHYNNIDCLLYTSPSPRD